MDRMWVSGTQDTGSIPVGATKRVNLLFYGELTLLFLRHPPIESKEQNIIMNYKLLIMFFIFASSLASGRGKIAYARFVGDNSNEGALFDK